MSLLWNKVSKPIYHYEVEWGSRGEKPEDPHLTENTHQRYVSVEAENPQEGELLAHQMVNGEQPRTKRDSTGELTYGQPNPIANMPDGMVTRTRHLD